MWVTGKGKGHGKSIEMMGQAVDSRHRFCAAAAHQSRGVKWMIKHLKTHTEIHIAEDSECTLINQLLERLGGVREERRGAPVPGPCILVEGKPSSNGSFVFVSLSCVIAIRQPCPVRWEVLVKCPCNCNRKEKINKALIVDPKSSASWFILYICVAPKIAHIRLDIHMLSIVLLPRPHSFHSSSTPFPFLNSDLILSSAFFFSLLLNLVSRGWRRRGGGGKRRRARISMAPFPSDLGLGLLIPLVSLCA